MLVEDAKMTEVLKEGQDMEMTNHSPKEDMVEEPKVGIVTIAILEQGIVGPLSIYELEEASVEML